MSIGHQWNHICSTCGMHAYMNSARNCNLSILLFPTDLSAKPVMWPSSALDLQASYRGESITWTGSSNGKLQLVDWLVDWVVSIVFLALDCLTLLLVSFHPWRPHLLRHLITQAGWYFGYTLTSKYIAAYQKNVHIHKALIIDIA